MNTLIYFAGKKPVAMVDRVEMKVKVFTKGNFSC